MAKFGSFFRRIFSSFNNNNNNNDDNNNVQIIHNINEKPELKCGSTTMTEANSRQSCDIIIISSADNRIGQQRVIIDDNISNNSNYLSSSPNLYKNSCRRLSAPIIISPSSNDIENQLLSSLHRLSLSSSAANAATLVSTVSGKNSPTTGSITLSNSNLSSTEFKSGTPPVVPSPRLSNQSNYSSSSNAMKDIYSGDNNNQIDNSRKMSMPNRGRRPSMFDPIDPTELQAALYATAIAKSNSPTCQSSDEDQNHAHIQCSISYDRDNGRIQIDNISFDNIFSLESLSQQGPQYTPCDPVIPNLSFYCRFRLHPERRSLFQTKIIRLNRTSQSHLFDDELIFEIKPELLLNHSIEILMYTIGKKNFKDVRVGIARINLQELYECDRVRVRKVLNEIENNTNQDPDLGELLISMSYLPSAGKLAVVIVEAKNLRPLSIENSCVKVTLLRDGRKIKRKKTSVQRSNDNPTFNEELVFELRKEVAAETMIEIRVVHESLSWKENLGCVLFSSPSSTTKTEESSYWKTVLDGQSLKAKWKMLKPVVNT
ncbi:unnamed protein product [Didymodactylos carnosus]|uniref:C2 domain-containing protein n=1 Tax=Didymodactylos carnosus TaxID=1234261 RepID=A0A8S2DUK7_9BILA|nr:unnamed protein product [Didymodactylos carnosus]CAF3755554.1 unnamed protein product [Didymodactylos carnosus]